MKQQLEAAAVAPIETAAAEAAVVASEAGAEGSVAVFAPAAASEDGGEGAVALVGDGGQMIPRLLVLLSLCCSRPVLSFECRQGALSPSAGYLP